MDPNYIAHEIDRCEVLIEQLRQEISRLLQKILELRCSVIVDDSGEITSYADWAA
jgi:hypothetical protein